MMKLSRHNSKLRVVAHQTMDNPREARRNKVAIVGFEQAIQRTAPLDDPSYEVWAFNHANRVGFMLDAEGGLRADRWFDLHEARAQSADDMAWIDACPVPIYLPTVFSVNANAVAYPIDEIIEKYDSRYFCSSFAYALVLAHYLGFKRVEIHGCNLNWGRERAVERANLEYWIGRLGADPGFTIDLAGSPELCASPYLYGFEYDQEKQAVQKRMAGLVLELLHDEQVRGIAHSFISEKFAKLADYEQKVAKAYAEYELLRQTYPVIEPAGIVRNDEEGTLP